MTTGEMLDFTNRFESAKKIKNVYQRDRALSQLMTEMEQTYHIPMFKNEKFEEENPYLMQLYRTISFSRTL